MFGAKYRALRREHEQLVSNHAKLHDAYYNHLARKYELSDDDREALESIATEVAGELRACDLIDAEAVNACTLPVPIVEIEYDGYVVEMALSIHHHEEDEA